MDERLYDLIFICRPATPEEEINNCLLYTSDAADE